MAQFQHQIIKKTNDEIRTINDEKEVNSSFIVHNSSFPNSSSLIPHHSSLVFGYLKTLTGRGVFLPKYPQKFENRTFYSVKGPDATAAYWSMAEADIMKQALGELVLIFDKYPHYQSHIGNMCHDEIDVICAEKYALEVAVIVQETMRKAMATFITIILVDEAISPDSLICQSW